MATDRNQQPSEFGGRPGPVQKQADGHTPDPSERQVMLRRTDPSPKWTYTKPQTGGQGSTVESYDEPLSDDNWAEYGDRVG